MQSWLCANRIAAFHVEMSLPRAFPRDVKTEMWAIIIIFFDLEVVQFGLGMTLLNLGVHLTVVLFISPAFRHKRIIQSDWRLEQVNPDTASSKEIDKKSQFIIVFLVNSLSYFINCLVSWKRHAVYKRWNKLYPPKNKPSTMQHKGNYMRMYLPR